MTSTKPALGTILNKNEVQDKQSGPVKVSVTLAVGLVYKDGANGWTNAPTDGSINGDQLYWNDKVLTGTTTLGEITGTFYGEGARVVGKSDGIIPVDGWAKASTSFANGFITNADPSDASSGSAAEINAVRDWQRDKIALYKGHVLELNKVDTLPTASADTETDCVFEIRRG